MSNPVVIKARTVGVVSSQSQSNQTQTQAPCTGTACVCIKVANATSLANSANFTGSANLTLNGCSLEVDDTGGAGLNLSGSAVVSATNIYLANASVQYSASGTTCDAASQGTAHCNAVTGTLAATPPGGFTDPYQAQLGNNIPVIKAGALGGCQGATVGTGGGTLGPNMAGGSIYFSQIRITSSTALRAGTYYICPGGNLTISGSSIVTTAPFPLPDGCSSPYTACNGTIPFATGDGVTLVFLGLTPTGGGAATSCAYFSESGSAGLQLVPPATGPYAGIVITSSINCTPPAIGASGNQSGTAAISGGSAMQLFGAIDLPDYSITYSGSSSAGTGGCLNIIANSFSVTGSAGIPTIAAASAPPRSARRRRRPRRRPRPFTRQNSRTDASFGPVRPVANMHYGGRIRIEAAPSGHMVELCYGLRVAREDGPGDLVFGDERRQLGARAHASLHNSA